MKNHNGLTVLLLRTVLVAVTAAPSRGSADAGIITNEDLAQHLLEASVIVGAKLLHSLADTLLTQVLGVEKADNHTGLSQAAFLQTTTSSARLDQCMLL